MESSHLNKPAYRSKHEDVKRKRKRERHQNHTMWGGKVRKYRFFFFILMMCLSLYDYQAKASRYRKGLTYLKKQGNHKSKLSITFRKTKKKRTQA